MERKPPQMTKHHMVSRPHMAKQCVEDTLRRVREIESDMRREARLAAQPCMSCGSPEQYGSTSTDALCMPCARDADLCKHCGGDLEMRIRRRHWPEPKQ